ncbi:MAG: hypothetical protein E7812_08415 [Phenylobacterium sp.]|nr:MAG: hypothetical protein E7812_08415 [Phenylobacterium sp.]
MQKVLLGAAAAAMAFTSVAAAAQPFDGRRDGDQRGQYQQGHDQRSQAAQPGQNQQRGAQPRVQSQPQQRNWNNSGANVAQQGWNRGGQQRAWTGGANYAQRGWNGGAQRYAGAGRWREGQVFTGFRDRGRMISDWGRYHLPPPRYGYAYYYDDSGEVVMAALASGLIGLVIGDAIADQGGYAQPYEYGYAQPAPYGYQAPYGYAQPYPY